MTTDRPFETLAVVGAGNMGSGIAQKIATEGFPVLLVDLDDEKAARGRRIIEQTLADGVLRKIFTPEQVNDILGRVHATSDFKELAAADLVVEAVFEDFDIKKRVFARLDDVCKPDAILATNTSSYSVTELAAATRRPERVIGLHYFYHPAKNRLVEVVGGKATNPHILRRAWRLQEALGKTPIASSDSYGFIVNRFFLPWLTEAVRMLDEGVAGTATIDEAAKEMFGIGMGPFELMNVTGVPIALHTATTLGRAFGPLYEAPPLLRSQVESGQPWPIDGTVDRGLFTLIGERLATAVFYVAAALVDEGVGTIDDTDIGARVGLRWRRGPFELMNRLGVTRALDLVEGFAAQWQVPVPRTLAEKTGSPLPFRFTVVRTDIADGIATLTINRPDTLNAINGDVLTQLEDAFAKAVANPAVKGIVLAAAGKAFIAGADIRFFVRNIEEKQIDRIAAFTKRGQELLRAIETCAKPVIARVHGMALGGGVEIALACHRIIATPKATFAFPETGIGIYPGLGGTQRTTRRMGKGLAKWLVLTGETIGAEEAASIGLIDKVVPYEELDAAIAKAIAAGPVIEHTPAPVPSSHAAIAAYFDRPSIAPQADAGAATPDDPRIVKAAKRITFKAPIALRIASDLIDRGAGLPLAEGLRMEFDHLHEIFQTKDAYEGLSSLGKKAPVFTGT
jgi:enoyl-CoA hydratase/3-hydroxyacyl-CoA dehydrogenase